MQCNKIKCANVQIQLNENTKITTVSIRFFYFNSLINTVIINILYCVHKSCVNSILFSKHEIYY